tara:strand:- start:891 stop:1286 length:396 start_codon:yes stop_codon:yes gene_type:complete
MGLDFIKDKTQSFTQCRDRSRENELEGDDLITRAISDTDVDLFRCRLVDQSADLVPGLKLVLRVHSESEIVVSQSGKVVAMVEPNEAMRLAELMRTTKVHTGILTVLTASESDIAGEFFVKPKQPFKKPRS